MSRHHSKGKQVKKHQQPTGDKRQQEPWRLDKPVFFVGFMGAGKSSVARRLARKGRVASVDVDFYLERREGKKITHIFDESGEEGFRAIETDVLKEIIDHETPSFVSCGGGIIKQPENRELLQRKGFVIYLKVSAQEAAGRISDLSTRPLFNDVEDAQKLNEERDPLYEQCAHAVINTSGKSVGRIAVEVQRILEEEGILWRSQK